MRKFKYLTLIALMLASCTNKGEIVKENKFREPKEIVLNVVYRLNQDKFFIYKVYEGNAYEWYFSPNYVNFIKAENVQRADIPTKLTYTTESEYYSCINIFYNYGESCAIITL